MKSRSILAGIGFALVLASCENPMTFRTKVNEDGSLDKTIVFAKADEKLLTNNIFGIKEQKNWSLKKGLLPQEKNSKTKEYRIEFSKHFASDTEMNKELNTNSDTLFHVASSFEKKYRWFFTYIRYSETIRPINRFKLVLPADFFNQEDSTFIRRLPSEGRSISKADSVYLDILNEKITDRFATRGMFNEFYEAMKGVIKKNSLGNQWLDTLRKNRDFIYQQIEKGEGDFKLDKIVDKLKIPLAPEKANKDFEELSKDFNSRLDFMSFARDGKYYNEFEMPWAVTNSNADSVAGNRLSWRPLVHKFIFMDYEMYAESRKVNLLETILSAIIVSLTAFVLWKSSRTQA